MTKPTLSFSQLITKYSEIKVTNQITAHNRNDILECTNETQNLHIIGQAYEFQIIIITRCLHEIAPTEVCIQVQTQLARFIEI